MQELKLEREGEAATSQGLVFLSLAIPDRAVPTETAPFRQLVEALHGHLAAGASVAIHCRAGIGRSSVLAAAVLAAGGVPVDEAFSLLSACRGLSVPDTPAQRAWTEQFVAAHPSGTRGGGGNQVGSG